MRIRVSTLVRGPLLALVLLASSMPGLAGAQTATYVEDFTRETIGTAPLSFSTPVGYWSVATLDGAKPILFEDGTQWNKGTATSIADQAKALYGDRWNEFVDDLAETGYFPQAIYKPVENFTNGLITMRFMIIGGDVDQDVGIMFDYKPNGDYYALRSDTNENNMLLYQWILGQPTSRNRVRNVPTAFAQWHDQQLYINGTQLEGYLDGQKFMEHTLTEPVSGRVGVWAKADTVALIDYFVVQPS
jgi:hypothetical protein